MFDGGQDRGLVFHDPSLQLNERFDAAAAGPANPPVQRGGCLGGVETEDQPESFLQQVGPVQPWVGLGDPGQLRLLPAGQVLRVLPQRRRGSFQRFGVTGRPSRPATSDRAAGEIPGLPTDLVQCVGGPLDDMERIGATDRLGHCFATTVEIHSAPSAETWVISADRSGPSWSKNEARVALSRPGFAHTSRPES